MKYYFGYIFFIKLNIKSYILDSYSSDFIPIEPQPHSHSTSLAHQNQSPSISSTTVQFIPTNYASQTTETARETQPISVPKIDVEEILNNVEAVIPDIDLDAARRTITSMNPILSTNDIVSQFLDNGYTKKLKRSSNSDRNTSLKRSWSDSMDDILKFLSTYPDPVAYFFNTQRKQSELYITHAKAFLIRAFPTTDKDLLEQTLQEENYHFLSTVRKLERQLNVRTNGFLQRTFIKRSLDMFLGM